MALNPPGFLPAPLLPCDLGDDDDDAVAVQDDSDRSARQLHQICITWPGVFLPPLLR